MRPIYLVYDERMKLHVDLKHCHDNITNAYLYGDNNDDNRINKKEQVPIAQHSATTTTTTGSDVHSIASTTNCNNNTESHCPSELLTEVESSSSSSPEKNKNDDVSDIDNDNNQNNGDSIELPVENPKRIAYIYNRLNQLEEHYIRTTSSNNVSNTDSDGNCNKLFIRLSSYPIATKEEITLAHSSRYYDKMAKTQYMSNLQLQQLPTIDCNKEDEGIMEDDDDMYFCKDTFTAALLACGGVIQAVNKVTLKGVTASNDNQNETNNNMCSSTSTRALAIVRPPGHHSCAEKAMGFCFFNSVVVAAKHALHTKRASKVLIIDWDIHHGNGSQELTYNDEHIMYISLHRYFKGTKRSDPFFPGTGLPTEIGLENTNAHGMNLNIAWNKSGMGNSEYAAAFSELILPIVSQLSPDLVLISCGLDAAEGDFLGDCELTPYMYHILTKSVMITVGVDVPIVVALEGGYNLEVISSCMEDVACALLDIKCGGDNHSNHFEGSEIDREHILPQDYQSSQSFIANIREEEEDALKLHLNNGLASNDNCARLIRLENSREMLRKFWNRNSIKKAAIVDINKSIRAIQGTKWFNNEIKMMDQKTAVMKKSTRATTRSMSNQNKDSDISNVFQSLHL